MSPTADQLWYLPHEIGGAGNIASAEAFGTMTITAVLTSAGNIASSEAVGEPALIEVLPEYFGHYFATGYFADGYWGRGLFHAVTGAGDIASAEQVGWPKIEKVVDQYGQVGRYRFTMPMPRTISRAGGIGSEERFGRPAARLDHTDDEIVMMLMQAAWKREQVGA